MNTSTLKKISNVATRVFAWILIAFTVSMMVFTIFTVTTVDKNDRNIFGIKFYIVRTGSMSLSENNKDMKIHFNEGDIVIIKNVKDKTALQKGDVISFMSTNEESYGETVTHMIYDVKTTTDGKVIGYVTYGTNTGAIDSAIVEPTYVLGKYAGKLPGVGHFFAFVKSTQGYILCILIPFLLLILYNGMNVIRLFKQYKREQMADMQAERDKIDAERAENQRMMQELLALKAQLEGSGAASKTQPSSEASEENKTAEGSESETPKED